MRYFTLFALAFCLAACGPSKAERWAKFREGCEAAAFSEKQCLLLFAMKEDQDDDSAAVGFSIGLSTGVAAGSTARR